MSDPRKPALPVAIEEDPYSVVLYENGATRAAYDLTYTVEDTERLRLGYCCIHCGESQVDRGECPMPERCWLCGYPMRAKQGERFGKEFRGLKRIGPQTSVEDELAIAQEVYEREERAKDPRKLASQILIPGKDF